jgi:hypothetical protein
MAVIHEVHEVMGRTKATGRSKIPRDVVSPGTIEGVFGYRKELEVCISHFLNIFNQKMRQVPVVEKGVVWTSFKGSQVHFVNIHRTFQKVGVFSRFHPLFVMPGKSFQVINDGSGFRTDLKEETVGIGLQKKMTGFGFHLEFIKGIFSYSRDEDFPYSGVLEGTHTVDSAVPPVKVSHHTHSLGIGGPDGEMGSRYTLSLYEVRSQFLIGVVVGSFIKKMEIEIGKERWERVRVGEEMFCAVLLDFEQVGKRFSTLQNSLEKSFFVDFRKRKSVPPFLFDHRYTLYSGKKDPYDDSLRNPVHSQNREGITAVPTDHCLNYFFFLHIFSPFWERWRSFS